MKMHISLDIGDPMEALAVLGKLLDVNLVATDRPVEDLQPEGIVAPLVGVDGQPVAAGAPAVLVTTEAPKAQTVAFSEVELAVQRRAKRDGIPAVKAILAQFGAERARNLDPSQYAAFVEACNA